MDLTSGWDPQKYYVSHCHKRKYMYISLEC